MKAVVRFRTGRSALAVVVLAAVAGPSAAGGSPDGAFRPVRVVPKQPPITDFPIRPAAEAADVLNPTELVLGVTVGGHSRAYPINMLTGPRREILNDTLGGRPIAATW